MLMTRLNLTVQRRTRTGLQEALKQRLHVQDTELSTVKKTTFFNIEICHNNATFSNILYQKFGSRRTDDRRH